MTTTKVRYSRAFREGFYASVNGRARGLNPYLGKVNDDRYDEWRTGWEAHYYHEVPQDNVKPLPQRR